jgi:tryptophan-rich sensory protein
LSGLKQPVLGILATVLIMAIGLGFISLFDYTRFSGVISCFLISLIPMEIVMGVIWGMKQPRFAAERSQPVRGILFAVVAAIAGAVVWTLHLYGVGGGITPPTPMLTQLLITSVVVTFWLAIMWGGWPFTALIKNPIAAGLAVLVACYVINYIFFRIFFNYEFLKGAPVYVPAQDPQGMFNGWNAVVFYVTAIGVMFLSLCFDLWPFTKSPSLMKQPVLGIVWTILALVIGYAAFYIGVDMLKMDVVAFMVTVPIPFIFGTIVVLNMLQGSLFVRFTQPLKGVLNTVAAAVIGTALALMYRQLTHVVTPGEINPGPPGYQSEIWLASALLAVTFPFLVAYADFFTMWPLQRAKAEQVMETAGGR